MKQLNMINNSSASKNKKAGIIGILFGYLGIHDFMIGKPSKTSLHLALSFLPFGIFIFALIALFFVAFKCGTSDTASCKTDVDRALESFLDLIINVLLAYVIPIAFIGSWIWGIIEGITLLKASSQKQ